MTLAIAAIVVWIGLWALNVMLARWLPERQARIVVPIIFGLTLVLVVELLVTGLKVPFVILPKPSEMVARLFSSLPMLWEDFAQTILKGALTGYIMGVQRRCSSPFWPAVQISSGAGCCRWGTSSLRCRWSVWRRSWSCGSASAGNPRPLSSCPCASSPCW